MHDPMTLAHRIVNPIPKVSKRLPSPVNDALGRFKWTIRLRTKPYPHLYISPFIYIGKYELYFESLLDIWHTDPKGDIGPPCHGRKYWKWHIHHMSVKFPPWYDFKQKHINKCAWCGKKYNKELGRVNHSDGRRVYHSQCSTEAHKAHHAHDPRGCYNCSGKSSFEYNRKKDYDQRLRQKLFGALKK